MPVSFALHDLLGRQPIYSLERMPLLFIISASSAMRRRYVAAWYFARRHEMPLAPVADWYWLGRFYVVDGID